MAHVKTTANKITPRLERVDLKNLGVLAYDFDNLYPQRITDITNDSGTATTCLKLFTKFVNGNGANDIDFGKIKINKNGLTVNKLIRKMAKSIGHNDGIALHFNYNGLGKKTDISFIPWEYCRLTLDIGMYPDMIAVYDDWGKVKSKNMIKKNLSYIHKYDPSAVLGQVQSCEGESDKEKWANYNGQVLYWTPDGSDKYPLAPFDSVLEDMVTEAQTKRFKANTSAKNFLASHIVITNKEEADVDDNGDEIISDDKGQGISEALTIFQGGDGAGTMMHVERENEDEVIDIKKIELQNYDKLFEYTEESSTLDIVRQFLIPPILLLQTAGSLGSSKEIAEAKEYYNDITSPERDVIEELLIEAFTNFIIINKSGDYSVKSLTVQKPITAEYFPYYSKNEIRESNGSASVDDAISDIDILAVALGVGGTQALVGILTNPDLEADQKKGTIKVLFGLTEDQVNEMLSLQTNPHAK
jgi:hypothetical protein